MCHMHAASKFTWIYEEKDKFSYLFPSVIHFSFPLIAALCGVHKQEARLR